jgi:hypothetical protein
MVKALFPSHDNCVDNERPAARSETARSAKEHDRHCERAALGFDEE